LLFSAYFSLDIFLFSQNEATAQPGTLRQNRRCLLKGWHLQVRTGVRRPSCMLRSLRHLRLIYLTQTNT